MSWSTARKNQARDNAARLGAVENAVRRFFAGPLGGVSVLLLGGMLVVLVGNVAAHVN